MRTKLSLSILIWVCSCLSINAQDIYFPPTDSDQWELLDPAELGWCDDRIQELYDYLDENNTKGFMILKDGKIVLERYFDTFTADSTWYWASAGKTLTAFMVGLAQDQGSLSINDSTSDYLGEGWTSCPSEEETIITIKDQLCMTTGLDDGTGDIFCTDPECLQCLESPGTRWAYHNGPYTLLDQVLENATGTNLNLYVAQELTAFTGISGLFIPVGDNNVFFSKTRSLARFGLLLQNEGVWDDLVILNDNDYFHSMTSPSQDLNPSYGYLTWLNGQSSFMIPSSQLVFPGSMLPNAPSTMYAAMGKNGQIINVVPDQGLVVIRVGNAPDDGLVPFIMNDEIWEFINQLECESHVTSQANVNEPLIYPNPAEDQLHIRMNSPISQLSIMDQLGRIVLTSGSSSEVSTSLLPPGHYIIQIHTERELFTHQLIIK